MPSESLHDLCAACCRCRLPVDCCHDREAGVGVARVRAANRLPRAQRCAVLPAAVLTEPAVRQLEDRALSFDDTGLHILFYIASRCGSSACPIPWASQSPDLLTDWPTRYFYDWVYDVHPPTRPPGASTAFLLGCAAERPEFPRILAPNFLF
jgi:hypothetical protein